MIRAPYPRTTAVRRKDQPEYTRDDWQPVAVPFRLEIEGHIEVPPSVWVKVDMMLRGVGLPDGDDPSDDGVCWDRASYHLQTWLQNQADPHPYGAYVLDDFSETYVRDSDIDTLAERMDGSVQAAMTVVGWLLGIPVAADIWAPQTVHPGQLQIGAQP